jgi:multiple sugar transport system substrate-binding protein
MRLTRRRRPVARTRRVLPAATAATAVLAAGLAAGCTGQQTALPGDAQSTSGTVTIKILSGADTSQSPGTPAMPRATGMYSELQDWWNANEERRTHIQIQFVTVPGGATAAHSEMLADAESGDGAYDIYNLDNEWVPEFAAGNFIWSLRGNFPESSDFLQQPLASGEYGGQLYAAPFTTDVGLLYYRTDLLSSAQVRKLSAPHFSFANLTNLAEQVMQDDPRLAIGYAGQFAGYEGLTVNLLEIAHGEDPGMFAANGTITDSGGLTTALTQLSGFMSSGTSRVLPRSELTFQELNAEQAFAGGTALFMRNWPIYYEQIRADTVGKGADQVANHVAVAPLPFPSVLGGQDLAIAKTSHDPAAALTVIDYLTSPQAEQCLFQVGGFPATRASAYTRKGLPRDSLCGKSPGPEVSIGSVIERAIKGAFLRPRTPYYTEFSSIIQNEVESELSAPDNDISGFASGLTTALNAAAASGQAPPSPSASSR